MKTSRIIITFAIMCLVTSLVLAACGTETPTTTPTTPPTNTTNPTTPPVSTTNPTTNPTTSTPAAWWSAGIACVTCHASQVASFDDPSLSAYAHAQAGHEDCEDCHGLTNLQEAHKGPMTVPPSYFSRNYTQDFCLACHGTYQDIALLTAGSTAFETPAGDFINPHERVDENHADNVECYSCHKSHSAYDAINYCYNCHHERELISCNNCHDH